jgi:hypothetical protein
MGGSMMTIASYGLLAFAVIFGGGMLGLFPGKVMPERYRTDATKSIVQTATGMVSLLAALVLGLLVATAKNKFDTANKQTEGLAGSLMLLDRELVNYGADASDVRSFLRQFTVSRIADTWPQEIEAKPPPNAPPTWKLLEGLQQKLRGLAPQSDAQRAGAASALQIVGNLEKTSWLETAQASDHVRQPFVLILIAWLFVLFISFGLFAPRNALVILALLVGALAISGAIALIVDIDSPYEGIINVSPQPMQEALAKMSTP